MLCINLWILWYGKGRACSKSGQGNDLFINIIHVCLFAALYLIWFKWLKQKRRKYVAEDIILFIGNREQKF